MTEPRPIAVVQVDLQNPITEIVCRRDAEPAYGEAWILVRRGRQPLGSFTLPLLEGRISAATLEQEIGRRVRVDGPSMPDVDRSKLPSATVVVPSIMSRLEQLNACIEHLKQLDYPDFEILVVDNRPLTAAAIELPGVRVIREPRPGCSAARNAGMAVATGEIVAFTDDDVEVDPGWLLALGERFVLEPDLCAVSGLVVPRELEFPAQILFERCIVGDTHHYSRLTFVRHRRFQIRRIALDDGSERVHSLYATGGLGGGSSMAFRTSVLRSQGGFDVALGPGTATQAGEDLAVLLELLANGCQLAYEPAALVFHNHRRSIEELRRQIQGYGMGFTAMLTAITLRDRRQLVGLASVLPAWVRSLRGAKSTEEVTERASCSDDLRALERKAMLGGPVKYLAARRAQRRWQP
jgi:glycosyltransferase involved in cell wall biosynthesis